MADGEHGGWQVEIMDREFLMFLMFMPNFGDKTGIVWRCH